MLSDAIEVLGWTLLHFVWQGAVVGAVAAMLLVSLRQRSANARYGIAVSALGLMLLLPLGTIAWIEHSPPPGEVSPIAMTTSTIEIPRTHEVGTLAVDEPPIKVERIGNDFENPPPADAKPLKTVSDTGQMLVDDLPSQRSDFDAESFLKPFIPWAVGVWLIGVGVLSLRLFASWWSVRRLRRRATQPAGESWQALLRQLSERLRVTRPVKLVESALVEVPAVIGWLRPIILLPATAMTGLTIEQLEALLAHELAHVRRHDYLINLLQTIVETLLFYHPAVWWLSHRIRLEREHCCDDLAASVCGDRLSYAKALVAMEELRAPKLHLAMSSRGGSLRTRIARLLGRTAPAERRSAWFVGAVLLAVVGMIGVAWALQAEVDPDDHEYAITLDNGVTVRLLAVCDLTLNEEKNWWRPNGAALREPLKYIQVYGKGGRNIGSGREFALEIEGLPAGQHAQVLVNENGAGGATRFGDGSPPLWSMRVTSNLRSYYSYFAVSHRRADMQVRLTDGNWGPWQRVAPDGQRDLHAIPNELRALYEEVQLKQVHESGRVDLGWQHRFDVRAQMDVRVVDVDGVIHRERAGSGHSATGGELGFTVPRNRVQWVEYRLWPMSREVTFQNISLRPGLRTKVTIGERRLIAKTNTEPSSVPNSTHYLATWSAQMDSQFKDELLTASQATRIHDLPVGQVFVADTDSLRECLRQQLATNDRGVKLVDGLTWLRSSDEVTGFSSRTSGYFHLRADPGFDGSAYLWGDFALTLGESSGRLAINGQWRTSSRQDAQTRVPLDVPIAFAADVKDRQAIVLALSMPDGRIGLVVAEYVRVPLNHWGEISRAYDARHWLVTGPESLLAAVERSAQWVSGVKTPITKPLPKWTRTLSDGTQVSLLGLTNPVRTPFVWWTADGSPLRFGHGRWTSHKPHEDRLVALVRIVTPTDTERDRGIDLEWLRDATSGFSERQRILFEQRPDVSGPPGRYILVDANSETPSQEVAIKVQVGEWQSLGEVRVGQQLVLDKGRCEVRLNDSRQPKLIWTSFTRPQPVDQQLTLVAISKSGERVRASNEREEEFAPRRPEDRVWHSQPQFQMTTEDLSHFEVESRQTESIRFQDFATEPKQLALGAGLPTPPDKPTEGLPKLDNGDPQSEISNLKSQNSNPKPEARGEQDSLRTQETSAEGEKERRKLPPPKGEIYDAARPDIDRFKPKRESGSVSGAISGIRRDNDPKRFDQFTGRVRLKTEKPLPDLEKVVVPAGKVLDESLVFSKDGGLANVFVYLPKPTFPIEPPPSNKPPKPFVLIAEGGRFWPHASFVRVGRPIVFENRQTEHVNFRLAPLKNVSFNVLVQTQDHVKIQAFRYSESFPFEVKSDIQPWMQAHVLTLDHPFAAITDEEGRFAIDGLPPGDHEFRVWHERVGYLEKKLLVTLKPGEDARSELDYQPEQLKLDEGTVLTWGNRLIDATRNLPPRAIRLPPPPKVDDDAKLDPLNGSGGSAQRGASDPNLNAIGGLTKQDDGDRESEISNLKSQIANPKSDAEKLAIERGVAFLKSGQTENGLWPEFLPPYEGGVASLCVLAMLQSGMKSDDVGIQKALASLRKIKPDKTYTVALQTMVFCAASPKEDAELIRRGVAWIEKAQVKDGASRGGWNYQAGTLSSDGSNSRFAVMGLHAAKKAGFDVQAETWQRVSSYWVSSLQNRKGWGYSPNSEPSMSMTLAGIASLAAAHRYLPRDEQAQVREAAIRQPAEFIESGIPNSLIGGLLYTAQCLERAGHVSGMTHFGKLDWKADITKKLLNRQQADGSWKSSGAGENNEFISTSLALLALTGQPEPKPDKTQ